MKIAIVPAATIANAVQPRLGRAPAGTPMRLDAGFYCDPGKAQRRKAARNRELAAQHLRAAERYEVEANAEVERSRALGVVVVALSPILGKRVYACHFPPVRVGHGIEDTPDDRYTDRRPPVRKGEILLHGHSHSPSQGEGYRVHCGVDAWDLGPVRLEDIAAVLAERGIGVDPGAGRVT